MGARQVLVGGEPMRCCRDTVAVASSGGLLYAESQVVNFPTYARLPNGPQWGVLPFCEDGQTTGQATADPSCAGAGETSFCSHEAGNGTGAGYGEVERRHRRGVGSRCAMHAMTCLGAGIFRLCVIDKTRPKQAIGAPGCSKRRHGQRVTRRDCTRTAQHAWRFCSRIL